MMKRICCIALILLPFGLFGQMDVTGMGFIDFINKERNGREGPNTGELELYKNPNGSAVACLWGSPDKKYFIKEIADNQGKWKRLFQNKTGLPPFEWEEYYGDLIQYYEEKNGFIRVKFDDDNYWIRLDEIASNDGKLFPWKTYFLSADNHMQVLYNMNLRTAPTVESDKIMLVTKPHYEDDFHIIEMTDNIQGNWAEVNVYIIPKKDLCPKGYGGTRTIVKGWIKHLDDKGFPNIFPKRIPCG